jgi:hypothetical protein
MIFTHKGQLHFYVEDKVHPQGSTSSMGNQSSPLWETLETFVVS